jgi:hypothetical protein
MNQENLNPNFRAPELSGFDYFGRISGVRTENLNFVKPE